MLQNMNLEQRGGVVKMCQAQFIPDRFSSTALSRVLNEISPIDPSNSLSDKHHFQGLHFLDYASDLQGIMSPLMSALTLDVARMLPLPDDEILEARILGFEKELSVMESSRPAFHVQWRVIFDPEYHNDSILPGFIPNPANANICRLGFERWRDKVSSTVHYPRMTFKNVSRTCRQDLENFLGEDLRSYPIIGQINLQRIYRQYGYKAQGCVEVRQRWYTSGHKPRTYFAQGGKTYWPSSCLQDAFGWLCDEFPFTNHRTRLRPTRLRLGYKQILRIYDLKTFTSRMHEQIAFLQNLSMFCKGHPFTFMDAREGLVTVDLGEAIWEYIETCCDFPEVSYERIIDDHPVARHCFAGPLGVFGNLMTCTVPHGCLMFQAVDADDKINVAGDDGAIAEDVNNESMIDEGIRNIGLDHPEKRFRSDEPGCICLKRPLYQNFNQLDQGFRLIPPSLYILLHHGFGYRDKRYRDPDSSDETLMTRVEHLRVISNEIFRFVRSATIACSSLDLQDRDDVFKLVAWVQKEFDFPKEGCIQGFQGAPYTFPETLTGVEGWLSSDPLLRTAKNHLKFGGQVKLRKEVNFPGFSVFEDGGSFQCNSNKNLKFLVQLGYLEQEEVHVDLQGDFVNDLDGVAANYLFPQLPVVYQYSVISNVPRHLVIW
jgi:hypothetical protein